MRVCSQVTEHLVGAAEGWFAVDHPTVTEKLAEKTAEDFGMGHGLELSVELEFPRRESLPQCFDELATEDLAENCFRDKEVVTPGTNPLRVIRRETASRNDAVNMGMMLQFLVPGMQDAEESDFSAEMLGVSGDLDQRLGAEAEQQTIHHFLVLQGQRRQFVWERENDVGVRRGQQFGTARVEPAVAGVALALRAMPVAARIVGDGAMATARTLIDVAAQCGGAASLDGNEHFDVQPG